ncbi:Pantothenate kinase 4 [Boothiomyces sp. JEL0838]|nr:Pantothenate kinase 4 [Boothiomyces sp. JEL0838]
MSKMYRNPSAGSLNTNESFISENKKSDIVLPNQSDNIAHIAVDIGGSLAKVVWFSKQSQGGRLSFSKFETAKIDQCIGFLQGLLTERGDTPVRIKDLFREKLGVAVQKEDEMECLIYGLNFLVRQIAYEVFTYDERRPEPMQYENNSQELFPYMLVNIGSGVSIIKVTSDETYERISGTSLGGGTLWGLLGLLTDAKDYDEMLAMSKLGDNKNVDMLVGDIYGGDYSKIGLKSTTIASSFGKVIKVPPAERKSKFAQEDISASLLYLVSNNIGQIAYLNAQAHGIQRIYFSGFFISGHPITMNTLSYAIAFWSKGKIKAQFLRHEGYLGAVGAFLRDPPTYARLNSFTENFSSIEKNNITAVGSLEEYPTELKQFPLLLDPKSYNPDTTVLTERHLHSYWIDLLDANLKSLVDIATEKNEDALARAEMFEKMYRHHLSELKTNPNAYGTLSVRSLLNLREQCLREMGFNDIFSKIKQKENSQALFGFSLLTSSLDKLSGKALVDELISNILAGNMYDWGAADIQEMIKKGELDFKVAQSKIGYDPQFYSTGKFRERLLTGPPYKKCMIFVDNSGADLIFGILPFVRYLVSRGTEVVIAANEQPSVNDITVGELGDILEQISKIDLIIEKAYKSELLTFVSTGNASPCIDLDRVSEEVVSACTDVDLVIIEGMGRAIHTNYYAKLSVDTVKVAVFKNPQVAAELGAKMYDALFKYEEAPPY